MDKGTSNENKKSQIKKSFMKELDLSFKIFGLLEESTEMQSVYNIFLILKNTNPDLILVPFYKDFTMRFKDKIIPDIDVDYLLTCDVENYIRSSVTTEHIHNALIPFSKKSQLTLIKIHKNGSEPEKDIVERIGLILQKLVKLSILYNK